MKYRLEQSTAYHFLQMLPEVIKENPDLIDKDFSVSQLIQVIENSYAFTMIDENDIPIAMSGVLPLVPGIGNFWFHWGSRIYDYKIALVKEFKRNIEIAHERLKMHRLESYVQYGNKQHYKLNQVAGFKLECDKIEMGCSKGHDYHLFCKIWR